MRVLMTTDAVGGVWQYSLALARGLVELHGCRVMLVCLGRPSERDLAESIPGGGVEMVSLDVRLEWMPDSAGDVRRGLEEVASLAASWRPDLIHSNQFCFGLLECSVPKVVVGHSDLLGWMAWHRGTSTPDDAGLEAYRTLVMEGLSGASAVVCPSNFAARTLEQIYGRPATVIYNGLWPDQYRPCQAGNTAVVAGRLWDESKRAATAVEAVEGLPIELLLIGATVGPTGETARLPSAPNARYLGKLDWAGTRATIAGARFYLATSTYEPFGLAALEGAFCGCVLLANDTPAYREIWGDAAFYYRRDDAQELRRLLLDLLRHPGEVEKFARAARQRALARFSADRMACEYYRLYESLR